MFLCDLVSLISFLQLWLCTKNHTQGRTEGAGRSYPAPSAALGASGQLCPTTAAGSAPGCHTELLLNCYFRGADQTKPSQTVAALQRSNRRHTHQTRQDRGCLAPWIRSFLFPLTEWELCAKNKCCPWRKVLFF